MKLKKETILIILTVLLVIIAIPGLVNKQKGKNIKITKSSLLNTKYLNQINKIELNFGSQNTITFQKDQNWIGECDGLFFLADENLITEMIKAFSKTRMFTHVSKQVSDWKTYSLTEDSSVNIAFYNEDTAGNKNEFSSIFFGSENSDQTMIYLRNNRKPYIYQITNDLYAYFTQKTETFANMNLLSVTESTLQKIEQIEVEDFLNNQHKIYKTGDENFDSFVSKLGSLRGGTLYNESILNDDFFLCKTISATTMEKETFVLKVYSKNNGEDFAYFVKSEYPVESKINSIMEISSWTNSRLEF